MAPYSQLVVGCPLRKRGWILDEWREHVLVTCRRAGINEPMFAFVMGRDEEPPDWQNTITTFVDEPEREDVRSWGSDRYVHMVTIRNQLLGMVRGLQPDYFLSVDSDILMSQDSLPGMLQTIQKPDAWVVGGKVYMTTVSRDYPSYGQWISRKDKEVGFKREDRSDVLMVDVVMALKLMRPEAYNVDYSFHPWGEDPGWCANVAQMKGHIWWDGRYPSKHVMSPELLTEVDPRVGY